MTPSLVVFTRAARSDLVGIWIRTADDDPETADRFVGSYQRHPYPSPQDSQVRDLQSLGSREE